MGSRNCPRLFDGHAGPARAHSLAVCAFYLTVSDRARLVDQDQDRNETSALETGTIAKHAELIVYEVPISIDSTKTYFSSS